MPETTAQINLRLKDEATKGLNRIRKSFGTLKTAIKGLTVAAGAVAGVGVAIAAMAQKGEEIIALRTSFKSLASGIGENADEMLAAMQAATSGLVSNAELIEKANNAILLGLPVTTESMAEMSEAAIVLGRAMGIDATSALDSMILGLGRQSKMILDNLGLTVDAAKANEIYAQELGKTANELTDAERKQAFFNDTMAAATEKVKELGGVVLGFGGQIAQARTSIVNFKDDLFAFTAVMGDQLLPAFTKALGLTDDFGQSIKFNAEIATEFSKTVLVNLVNGLVLVGRAAVGVADVFNIVQLVIFEVAAGIVRLAEGIIALGGLLPLFSDKFAGVQEKMREVSIELAGFGREGLKDIEANSNALESMAKAADEFKNGIRDIDFNNITVGMAGVAANAEIAANAVNSELAPGLEASASAAKEITKATEEMAAASKSAADAFLIEFAGGIPALNREELIETAKIFADALDTELPDLGVMATEDIQSMANALQSAVNRSVTLGLSTAFESGDVNAALGAFAKVLSDPAGAVTDAMGLAISAGILATTGIPIDPSTITDILDILSKDLPGMLFGIVRDTLIRVVAELPLFFANIIPDLLTPLTLLMPDIIQSFVRNLPVMIKGIIQALPELIKAIIFQMPEIIKVIPILLDAMLSEFFPNWWAEQKPVLVKTLKEAALELIEFFRSGTGDLMKDVGLAFDEFIIQPYLDMWRFAFGIATEVFDQTYGRLPELARQAGELVAGPLGDVVDSFQKVVESIPGAGGNGGVVGQVRGALGFQAGTPFVPRTMLAQVHQGEAIIPAAQNPFAGGGGTALGGDNNFNFTFILAPGTPQDQATQVINLFQNNDGGIADKVRRVIFREG